jgi:hypothetical protein
MADDHGKDDKEDKSTPGLGDTVKKLFTAGVSAAFMTEESVRQYLAELKLPKEILNLVIQSANKSKEEITSRVTKEVVNIVQKVDFVKEASRFAESHKFRITMDIDITKKHDKKSHED